jgi:proteasome lid subunit RPN8/RPN11
MAKLIPDRLQLTVRHKDQLIAAAEKASPREVCGLLAGSSGKASRIFAITNISPEPSRFTMHPQEQISAFYEIEKLGLEVVAIYHSHPFSNPYPSATDIRECYFPEIPQLIIGKKDNTWALQAFLIQDGEWSMLDLEITLE